MASEHPVNLLMFGTLAVVLVVLIVGLMRFMRHRSNRHPMDGQRERTGDEIRDQGPPPRR